MVQPVDVSVFHRIKTKADFDREEQEFNLRRQLQQAQVAEAQRNAIGGNAPAAVQEWRHYNAMSKEDQQRYLQMKRADQIMNLGGSMAVRGQLGGIAEQYNVTPKPEDMPGFRATVAGAEANARNQSDLTYNPQIKAAEKTAEDRASVEAADNKAIPIIEQLTKYNQAAFDMPYSDTLKGVARVVPSEKVQSKVVNSDLLKQARLELAAPLAKQLGVNPTDKDFEASLDRIFNINSSKESRQAQIDALAERIRARQKPANSAAPLRAGDVIMPNEPAQPQASEPQKGQRVGEYMFMGGDPSQQSNWKKVK